VNDTDHALHRSFAGALAAFVTTGSPNGPGLDTWEPTKRGAAEHIRVF
jgi:para-nitrobenzyl esterase